MATYFVDFAKTDDTADGLTWTNAKKTLQAALNIATTSADVVVVKYNEPQILSADTTFTAYNNISIIFASADDTNTAYTPTPQGTTYYVGHTSMPYQIYMAGGYNIYVYGATFLISGAVAKDMSLVFSDNQHIEYEDCHFLIDNNQSGSRLCVSRNSGSAIQMFCRLIRCNMRFGQANQGIASYSTTFIWDSGEILNTGPRLIDFYKSVSAGSLAYINDVNLSYLSTSCSLFSQFDSNAVSSRLNIIRCKLPNSFTLLGAGAVTPANKASASILVIDSYNDVNFNIFGYADALGSVLSNSDTYLSNNISFKVVTSSNCSYTKPFVVPNIVLKNIQTNKELFPCIEGMSPDSIPKTHEVWVELSTISSLNSSISWHTNRLSLKNWILSLFKENSSGVAASNWNSAYPGGFYTFKLCIPSTINMHLNSVISMRVCFGKPNATYYIDPVIRI